MGEFLELAFGRTRTALLVLTFVLLAGASAYLSIPKESDPDVAIPIVYVSVNHDGISPEDAERLLVRPLEKELQSIAGVKEMSGTAGEGFGSVMLEFDAGFDSKRALDDVRERVDTARTDLPAESDDPVVNEVNVALFPVLTVALSGAVDERVLVGIARELKDRVEALAGVLSVEIAGQRDELMEVVVEPTVMETYGISHEELFALVSRNSRLVAAGALDTGSGRLVLKVPGIIEDVEDVLRMPVKVDGDRVVTFADVATVRRTFKDPRGFARVDGHPALGLEVSKRIGANIIETIEGVRAIVEQARATWPASVRVRYLQDKSKDTRTVLTDLQNNVASAIVLVMIVVVAALGVRSALLVGLAIPGSFLAGIFFLNAAGYTLNIVVLFSLILVVGMLVDGAIVVTEVADRERQRGASSKVAFLHAAQRMAWPVTASTATTLAVFFPLLYWPGVIGEFMKYLPITVIACLSASLLMALIFVPILGGVLGGGNAQGSIPSQAPARAGRFSATYARLLELLLRRPALTLGFAFVLLVVSYGLYAQFGKGVEFFPDVEQDFAQVVVRARGDLSVHELDAVVRRVEQRVLGMEGVRVVYTRSYSGSAGSQRAEDTIGVLQLEFTDWDTRAPVSEILEKMRARTADVPGIVLEFRKQESNPGGGKPIQVTLSSPEAARLPDGARHVHEHLSRIGGFVDVEDNLALPGIEWRLVVDREAAARFGADIQTLGNAVQMVSHGIKVASYRPDDSDDEIDIRVRFPFGKRNLDKLDELRVPTSRGMVPISNFVRLVPSPKTGTLHRQDGRRVVQIQADVAPGLLVDDKTRALREALASDPAPGVEVSFKGEDAEQREAAEFLQWAFITAVFLMAVILVTQFNSVYQAGIVLSAIVFSTAGVLLGLLVTGRPFGIVMVGIGIIALAGIVVNNNIVLIDTFNRLRRDGQAASQAALATGVMRLRPVLLTAVTTILGLMPMVLAMNVDLLGRTVSFGAPSTQWWTQLSSAIVGGLGFATVLTLLLTPCLLVLGERVFERWRTARETSTVENPSPAQSPSAVPRRAD